MGEVILTKISSKGQVVIPKVVRDLLDIKEGEVFAVLGWRDTIIMKRVDLPSKGDLEEILKRGHEHAREKGITREDVDRAIHEYRKERKA
jgi:AbrB family looped-hinge helix DNA binding protein